MLMFSKEDLVKTLRTAIQRDKRDLRNLRIETRNDVSIKKVLTKRIHYMQELLKRSLENEE